MLIFDHEITLDHTSWIVFARIRDTYEERLLEASRLARWISKPLSFGTKEKKREYLASRLLLSDLAAKKGVTNMALHKDKRGAPYLRGASYTVSITHDYPYVGVSLAKRHIGIDVEKISAQAYRVREKFLSRTECLHCEDHRAATLYWSVKESVYKCKRGTLRSYKHIIIQPQAIDKLKGKIYVYLLTEHRLLAVDYFFVDGYVCTYMCGDVWGPATIEADKPHRLCKSGHACA